MKIMACVVVWDVKLLLVPKEDLKVVDCNFFLQIMKIVAKYVFKF